MKKIDIDIVNEVLSSNADLTPAQVKNLVQNMVSLMIQEKEEAEKKPKQKKDLMVVHKSIVGCIGETAWVIQKEQTYLTESDTIEGLVLCNTPRDWGDMEVSLILRRMVHDLKQDAKFMKKGPFTCLADLFEAVTPKLSKPYGIVLKTKLPVSAINIAPRPEESQLNEAGEGAMAVKNTNKPTKQ